MAVIQEETLCVDTTALEFAYWCRSTRRLWGSGTESLCPTESTTSSFPFRGQTPSLLWITASGSNLTWSQLIRFRLL